MLTFSMQRPIVEGTATFSQLTSFGFLDVHPKIL